MSHAKDILYRVGISKIPLGVGANGELRDRLQKNEDMRSIYMLQLIDLCHCYHRGHVVPYHFW